MTKLSRHQEITILVAEDDDGHAELIRDHFEEAGIRNPIIRFKDGQEVLDFLFQRSGEENRQDDLPYLLLLDIRMPRVDGVDVLRQIKSHSELQTLPIIMLTTTDDPREVENCYRLGCNCYITKPINFSSFAETIRQLGLFIVLIKVPLLNCE